MPDFAFVLVDWYHAHKRDLPWRHTRDPYLIWLSEVILQQTRVAQGLPYYQRFVEAFPTVADLAAATEQEVLRLWQGLGYYSRARNMHQTAQIVVREHAGQFPRTYAGLLALKGVGPYTAAAIASFAHDEEVAVVDGNVYRVLARLFGLDDDIASPKGQRRFAELAAELLPKGRPLLPPSTYNQAIMEFGAVHCRPAAPDCPTCPFTPKCVALAQKRQAQLPVKLKKTKVNERYFHYLVFAHQDRVLMAPRGSGDIWQGLYDFPLVEGPPHRADDLLGQILAHAQAQPLQGLAAPSQVGEQPLWFVRASPAYRHVLTHQRLTATFYLVEVASGAFFEELAKRLGAQAYLPEAVADLPKPILIVRYLADSFF